ncbi:MAG TPA: ABC transporter ATP-binding protein [Candidatus Sabulitectum sp.]|nr:ABC transporter ATP-binding protein [Candidatus Sabulitectum sp.]HPJ29063.1 ABC transporter ATP-binding protein [Candidatus Sabulitectum sp.]HPR22871.1 ABC transporter ATP-binding protein [Candidatus Sabulitectum sp.]HRW77148.1 ABC transporter ATP-binding protein [Candidatus Sabulitectum sp.]
MLGRKGRPKVERSSLRSLYSRIFRHRKSIAAGIVALILVDGLQLIIPQILRKLIDGLAAGTAQSDFIWRMGLSVVAIAIGIAFCRFFWRVFIVGSSMRLERDLRAEFYSHLQKLPAQYYDNTRVGDIMAHATNDINAVRMAAGMATIASFDAIFMSAASIVMLLLIDVRLTLITMIPLPLIALMMTKFGGVLHDRFEAVQKAFSGLSEKAQESLSGIRVVKAYGDEVSERKLFAERARSCVDENVRLTRIWGFMQPLVMGLAMMSSALLLLVGGRSVIGGSISLGQFVAFSSYLAMLTWPMMAIGWVVNLLQRGAASMGRLERIMNTEPAITDGPVEGEPSPAIEVRNLHFTYPGTDTEVLKGISFELPASSTLGIVGRTGSGKTTLVELLMRLYDPPEGTVYIGGTDVRQHRLSDLRGLFGYVPQETFLFALSIAENIAFGAGDLPDSRVRRLADIAGIAGEIEGFPQGFETMVGERGVTLSGGQKQRVAIARALAVNPRILVLDDSLSAVDTETESAILDNLKIEIAGLTNVIIAHRISTVQNADLILVLDRGRLVEKGTHRELLEKDGYYAELYRMQQLEAEAERSRGGGDR